MLCEIVNRHFQVKCEADMRMSYVSVVVSFRLSGVLLIQNTITPHLNLQLTAIELCHCMKAILYCHMPRIMLYIYIYIFRTPEILVIMRLP